MFSAKRCIVNLKFLKGLIEGWKEMALETGLVNAMPLIL